MVVCDIRHEPLEMGATPTSVRLEEPQPGRHSYGTEIRPTRICTSLGSRMKFKTLCYPVFGRHKNTALPSF